MADDRFATIRINRTHARRALIVLAVVMVATLIVWNRVSAARAHDRLVDSYYCTLSGVGPYDRGPNSGELCIDLQ